MAKDPHAWLSAECKPTASDEARFAYTPTMYRPLGCVTDSESDSSPESSRSLPPAIFMVSVSDSYDEDAAYESARADIVHEDTEMVDETEVVNLGDDDGIKTNEQGIEDIDMPQCGNGKRKLPESWKGKEKDEGAAGGSGSGKGKGKDEEAEQGIKDIDMPQCDGNGKRKLPESWKGKGKEREEDEDEGMAGGSGSGKGKDEEADEGAVSGSGKGKGKEKDEEADEGRARRSREFVDLVIAALGLIGKTDDGSEDDENEHWFDMIQRKGFTFPKPRWWP